MYTIEDLERVAFDEIEKRDSELARMIASYVADGFTPEEIFAKVCEHPNCATPDNFCIIFQAAIAHTYRFYNEHREDIDKLKNGDMSPILDILDKLAKIADTGPFSKN